MYPASTYVSKRQNHPESSTPRCSASSAFAACAVDSLTQPGGAYGLLPRGLHRLEGPERVALNVRQVLQKPEVADNMPHSGPRNWSSRENWLKPVPLHDHIVKYGEPAKMICPYTGVDRLA